MAYLFLLLLFASVVCLIIGLIKPKVFSKLFKKHATRLKLSLIFIGTIILFSILIGATAPEVNKQQKPQQETPPSQATATTTSTPTPEETQISTPTPMEPKEVDYKVITEEDVSYAGCKRVALRIVVPEDSNKENVDYTLEKIIDSKKSQWQDITIWAYKNSEEALIGVIAYTMGMKEYSTCE